MFIYIIVCLIFGTTFGFIKMGIEAGFSPFLFAGIRFTVAGLLLLGFLAWKGQIPYWMNLRQKLFMVCCGVLMIGANFAGVYYGSQFLPSGVVSALGALTPLIVTVLVWLIERSQKITAMQFTAVLLGLAGVLSLGYSLDGLHWRFETLLGFGTILIAEMAFASGLVLSRRGKSLNISPIFVNGSNMLFGGVALSLLSWSTETVSLPSENSGWFALIYLIVFGSIIGHSLFMVLNFKLGSLVASSWSYITPGLAFMFGFFFLGEESSWLSLFGCLLILVSVCFITDAHLTLAPKLRRLSSQLFY